MLQLVITFNNYLHDFSSAMWLCALLVGYLLYRDSKRLNDANITKILMALFAKFNVLFWLSLLVVLLTGVVRVATSSGYEKSEAIYLIVKHIIFFGTLIVGIILWIRVKRHLKKG